MIPAPGVRKCKRCGAPMHPDATHCPRGHARALERRVEEAIHLQRRGGGGRYDPRLHARNRKGEFRDMPGIPDIRTAHPGVPEPTARESARARAEAQDAIQRANPNAIPEPTGPTAPGSLAGRDLTRVHPIEIDRELARLYGESHKYEGYIAGVMNAHQRDQARDRQNGRPPREMSPDSQRHLAGYRDKVAELVAEAQPMNDEFTRRGGWARYFKVTNGNGHVHKSMHCSTCYPTTEYAWLVDLAGKNEHQMVEAHGESACSVCFPSAPSEYEAMKAAGHVSASQRATNAERAARDAERGRRAAEKESKAISNPDGSPLKLGGRFGETVRTLVTARKQLVDAINELRMWRGLAASGHQNGPSMIAEHESNIELLVAAIAHKLNVEASVVRAEAEVKAAAKWRKETWRHG